MKFLGTVALGAAGYWLYKSGRLQPQIDKYRPQVDKMMQQFGMSGSAPSTGWTDPRELPSERPTRTY